MFKFNNFTIDLHVILWIIVATGVYALLLKFLQKNSPHRGLNEWGGEGQRLFEQCSKKLHFFYPEASLKLQIKCVNYHSKVPKLTPLVHETTQFLRPPVATNIMYEATINDSPTKYGSSQMYLNGTRKCV